ncbi:shikimate dehydrogenase [Ideonella sp. DXS29W]|uniref:Shikimate dehydrogenase (NADP(+)) n=1 Tax=Ideonella lacteola TaxID=2984193 RepID=A0ABU9BPN4_9BURK
MQDRDTPADRYAVIGNPVAHSRSPTIHAAFAAATGQHLVYERVLAPMDGFEATVRHFAAAGGRGCNVTVPFKFDAFRLCAGRSERATLAEAANVIRFDADGWWADNTDGIGLITDIEQNAGHSIAGQQVLMIGAGGASAGVLGPLLHARPARVVVANRTASKAVALCERHHALADALGVALEATGLSDAGTGFDLVLNASASSLGGGAPPVSSRTLRAGTLVVDLMYGPAADGFLTWAQAHGARARDGLGMLVEQAAAAFELWRGIRPATAPVLDMLRAQLRQGALSSGPSDRPLR